MQNRITAENFIRSAKPPTISAGVMQAKVIWKQMKMYSGITTPSEKVAAIESVVMPGEEQPREAADVGCRARRRRSAPGCSRRRTQMIIITQVMTKHCISTESMFLARTSPP